MVNVLDNSEDHSSGLKAPRSPSAEHVMSSDDISARDIKDVLGSEKSETKIETTEKEEYSNGSSVETDLQSPGFTVKLVPISGDAFDLQINPTELIQELHQVLMDKEETCHVTCFSLYCNGQHLDNFAEVKSISDLKQGAVVKVHEEPYTVREARAHIRHVRDLVWPQDVAEAYTGERGNSIAILDTIINEGGQQVTQDFHTNGTSTRANRNSAHTPDEDAPIKIPDEATPGNFNQNKQPLLPLIPPEHQSQISVLCLAEMSMSQWNPPPSQRRLKGDLLYIDVKTLESKSICVTACTRGFFINRITDDNFNPSPSDSPQLSSTLVDLFTQISPSFRKNFLVIQKRRMVKNVLTRVPTSLQHWAWIAPSLPHTRDQLRAEDSWLQKLGYEEHILGQTRDWNEELQSIREMPATNRGEKVMRERAMYKTYSDFISAATRGAISVIEGNMMPINPGESAKTHMFIYNNIFFSLGFDVKDHYKELGGDTAAYVACSHDLKGVRALADVESSGLYTLGTAVVDYRGFRVACQTIMPGVLDKEQEESVVHGSVDFGKKIVTHESYVEKLQKVAEALKSRPHKIRGEDEKSQEEHVVHTSTECKGIIGNDGRHYVLDLLRMFPSDVNFMPDLEDEHELHEKVQEKGFPKKHPHRLPQLRPELAEAFVDSRYLAFVTHATSMAMQQHQQKDQEAGQAEKTKPLENGHGDQETESSEKKAPVVESEARGAAETELNRVLDNMRLSGDLEPTAEDIVAAATRIGEESESQRQIIRASGEVAGSLSDSEFDVSFNLDAFSPHISQRIPLDQKESLEAERQVVKDAGRFLVLYVVPAYVKDLLQDNIALPLDSTQLTESLHARGINVRYLSYLLQVCQQQRAALSTASDSSPSSDGDSGSVLDSFERMLVLEILVRSAKHLFKTYMQNVESYCVSDAVALFLNCFLGAYNQPRSHVIADDDELAKLLTRSNSGSFSGATSGSGSGTGQKKNKHRKKPNGNGKQGHASQELNSWIHLTPTQLWNDLTRDVNSYFHYQLQGETIAEVIYNYNFIHSMILRVFCIKVGIQLVLKNYNFISSIGPTFSYTDILNLFPIVKHALPKAKEGLRLFSRGQNFIQQGLLRPGCELVTESLHFLNHVYGPIHPEIALCLRLLAHLNYILGDPVEAMAHEHKAIMMYERCIGFDHPTTVSEYLRLALYCFSNQQSTSALQLLFRARYLTCVALSEDHPEIAVLDTNIGLVLHASQKFDLALEFLDHALDLHERHSGKGSLKTALIHHLKACVSSCQGDFRSALQHEKEAFNIYKIELGEDSEKTRESSELLKHLTSQAVALQRRINEISRTAPAAVAASTLAGGGTCVPGLFITQPTHKGVLEMLNVINGFYFIQLRKEDEDNKEVETKQTSENADESETKSQQPMGVDGETTSAANHVTDEPLD